MLRILKVLQVVGVLLLGYWLGTIRPRYNYQEVAGNIIFTDSLENTYHIDVQGEIYTVKTELPLPDTGKSIIILTPQ